jgi:hypothetical protein
MWDTELRGEIYDDYHRSTFPAPAPKRELTLKAVLERIAFESEWAVTRDFSSPVDQWQQTMWEVPLGKELMRPLASGEIRARGIRSTSEGDEHGHTDIPASFWLHPQLDPHADRLLREPGYDYVMNLGSGVMYHDIRLSKADVDREWPPRSKTKIKQHPSPFIAWAEEWDACFQERLINSQVEYQEMQARERPKKVQSAAEKRPRDTFVSEALAYAALGRWGEKFSKVPMHLTDWEAVQPPMEQFREAALSGDLTVWGKRGCGTLFEVIPRTYWREHGLDVHSLMMGRASTVPLIEMEDTVLFEDLMVSRSETEAVWPHAG